MKNKRKYFIFLLGVILLFAFIWSCRAGKLSTVTTHQRVSVDSSRSSVRKADTSNARQSSSTESFCHSTKVINGVVYTLQGTWMDINTHKWNAIYAATGKHEQYFPISQEQALEYSKKCGY